MARKHNYKFERLERDRAKAAKKLARIKARSEKSDTRQSEGIEQPADTEATGQPADTEAVEQSADTEAAEQPAADK